MLGGKGFYRGSTVLISGTAGAGKSSLAALFADAAGQRGERCLYFAFEESAEQIMRNMRSIGVDLRLRVRQGRLQFHAVRPTHYGLEMHLAVIQRAINEYQPQVVVVDPITNLVNVAGKKDVLATLARLIDYLKSNRVTGLFTSLTVNSGYQENTDVGVSSLVDTWLMLKNLDTGSERNRGLSIIKSRGMPHSNQQREFRLTGRGFELDEAYIPTVRADQDAGGVGRKPAPQAAASGSANGRAKPRRRP
jgi:circadian clock protein KaiC